MKDASGHPLAAPRIHEAADGVVTLDGRGTELMVRIEPYAGMAAGDQVQLRWDTGVLRTSRIDTQVIDAGEVGEVKVFTVVGLSPGTARVSYLVGHPAGDWHASQRLTVTVRA
ncbi:hypothetical protein [Streptomyces spectabilis]|uniref:Uncharacterized protein n=1 Tax=Streptomyces spectabilis TaxID=68270 RepID=A0A5P2XIA2_STRST|nr:hypothetical protein [Streptomyces spectabilis]MBB5102497.1 hypothetical protein [Streptomyces spectabilis]MCI3907537.1 hypothetical protein [Streptomyces spectabilis]QEV64228.1 hypothetical protein CP982_40685 [Streptomyces spectabilis]GGV31508.1 hypothetical protein GCM10010245_51050 [Streptomyces spectabilis]